MEIKRELLVSLKTTMEIKGPYKLQILKNDVAISTIKIRMRDDVTHIVQLSQGEYLLKLLKADKEHLVNSLILPNFENGSQIKLSINDTSIDLNIDGIITYKTVDEYMDIINDHSERNHNNKKKKEKIPKAKILQPTIQVNKDNDRKIKKEDKEISKAEYTGINKNSNEIINIDNSNFITQESFSKVIENLKLSFNNEIQSLKLEIESLKTIIQNKNAENSN